MTVALPMLVLGAALPLVVTMIFSMSGMPFTSPSPRTMYCSDWCSMKLPLAFATT